MSEAKSLERADDGSRGRHLAEPARPLVVQARESSPCARKCRRITAQAKTRPSVHDGPGGDEQDEAVRCILCGVTKRSCHSHIDCVQIQK